MTGKLRAARDNAEEAIAAFVGLTVGGLLGIVYLIEDLKKRARRVFSSTQ